MEKLNPNLLSQMTADPDGSYPVIIACTPTCDALITFLHEKEIEIADQFSDLQLVVTHLTAIQLAEVTQRDEVESVELNEEVGIE